MVYLLLCQVADTPFHIRGDELRGQILRHVQLIIAINPRYVQ